MRPLTPMHWHTGTRPSSSAVSPRPRRAGEPVRVSDLLAEMFAKLTSRYELHLLRQPTRPQAGHEMRSYANDRAALVAFRQARSLLRGDPAGLGLAVMRDGCPVCEFIELPDGWSHLEVGSHGADCPSHAGAVDVFDLLAADEQFLWRLGYRVDGTCTRLCPPQCATKHGDLLTSLEEFEVRYLELPEGPQ